MTTETPDPAPQFSASRRRVMIASGASVLGVAGLAACGGGSDDTTTQATATTGTASAGSDGQLATPAAVPVIAVSAIPAGGAVAATVSGQKVLVTKPASGDPKVFSSICPHQGCTVAPNGTTDLLCPCHQSKFQIDTGAVEPGSSAQSGLKVFPSKVVDGQVVITSTTPGAAAN